MFAMLKSVSTVLLSVTFMLSLFCGNTHSMVIPINKKFGIGTNEQLEIVKDHHWRDCLIVLGLDWRTDPLPDANMLEKVYQEKLAQYSGGQYKLHRQKISDAFYILLDPEWRKKYPLVGSRDYACAGKEVTDTKDALSKGPYRPKPFVPPANAVPIGRGDDAQIITYSASLMFDDQNKFELQAGMQLLIGTHKLQYNIAQNAGGQKLTPNSKRSPAYTVSALNKAIQKLIKRHKRSQAAHAFIQIDDDAKNIAPIVGITQDKDGVLFMRQPKKSRLPIAKRKKESLQGVRKITIFGDVHSYTVADGRKKARHAKKKRHWITNTDDGRLFQNTATEEFCGWSIIHHFLDAVYRKEGGFMTVITGDGKGTDFYHDHKTNRELPLLKMRYFVDGNKELTKDDNNLICARDADFMIHVLLDDYTHGVGQFYIYQMLVLSDEDSIGSQSMANFDIAFYQKACKNIDRELKCYLVKDDDLPEEAAHAIVMDELEVAEKDAFLRGFKNGLRKYKNEPF